MLNHPWEYKQLYLGLAHQQMPVVLEASIRLATYLELGLRFKEILEMHFKDLVLYLVLVENRCNLMVPLV